MAFDGPRLIGGFAAGLAWRLGALLIAFAGLGLALATPGLNAVRIVAAAFAAAASYTVWAHVQRTNLEVARFVDAVRFGDLSASFSGERGEPSFNALGAALEKAIRALRDERSRANERSQLLEAVVDDLPVAVLLVDPLGRIELLGKSSRRLFGNTEGIRLEDFMAYGEEFAGALKTITAGERRLVSLLVGGEAQQAIVRAAALHRLGGAHRVIAVQPVQEVLNAVELSTQRDLVRVLTHEIMNSMTPITSLARSAAEMMRGVTRTDVADLEDVQAAVETLARRSEGVMHFVESYRQISRMPEISRARFQAGPFVDELARLFTAEWPSDRMEFRMRVHPADLVIDADPDLLAQVLINLLRNAAEAAAGHALLPVVQLAIFSQNGDCRIEVKDNGPGIPTSIIGDIFLPFFTTKKHGTGVGLSLAKQVVLAHGGAINATTQEVGTCFWIRL